MSDHETLTSAEEWEVTEAVTCVSCPACAFTFDAVHTDSDGGYSCPLCAEIRLNKALWDILVVRLDEDLSLELAENRARIQMRRIATQAVES